MSLKPKLAAQPKSAKKITGLASEGYNVKGNIVSDIVMVSIIGLEGLAIGLGVPLPNLGNYVFVPAGYRLMQAAYNGLYEGNPNTALVQLGEASALFGAGALYKIS